MIKLISKDYYLAYSCALGLFSEYSIVMLIAVFIVVVLAVKTMIPFVAKRVTFKVCRIVGFVQNTFLYALALDT